MRPVIDTVSSATTGKTLPIDYVANYFGVGFGCVVSAGGSLTYKVQHTFDDPNSASPTWFDHPTVTGMTANQDGNYAFPVRAIRLNVTVWASGSVTITALQGSSA